MAAVTFPEDKFYKNDIPFRKWLGDFEEYVLAAYGTVDNARKESNIKIDGWRRAKKVYRYTGRKCNR